MRSLLQWSVQEGVDCIGLCQPGKSDVHEDAFESQCIVLVDVAMCFFNHVMKDCSAPVYKYLSMQVGV